MVFIPEYVVGRWWEQILHNQSALRLKIRLRFTSNVIIVNVPWQLDASSKHSRGDIPSPSGHGAQWPEEPASNRAGRPTIRRNPCRAGEDAGVSRRVTFPATRSGVATCCEPGSARNRPAPCLDCKIMARAGHVPRIGGIGSASCRGRSEPRGAASLAAGEHPSQQETKRDQGDQRHDELHHVNAPLLPAPCRTVVGRGERVRSSRVGRADKGVENL